MTAYTKEQKAEYFKTLREKWNKNKTDADNDTDARAKYEAIHKEANGKFSYYSFYFTLMDMNRNGYAGNPYVDCKTFNGWREAGFRVKKGEKSKIAGITWIAVGKGENDADDFMYPKSYHLFHKTQVELIQ